MTDALGSTTSVHYDAVGNIISVTDALGHITKYVYDADNRRSQETYPDTRRIPASTAMTPPTRDFPSGPERPDDRLPIQRFLLLDRIAYSAGPNDIYTNIWGPGDAANRNG